MVSCRAFEFGENVQQGAYHKWCYTVTQLILIVTVVFVR